MRITFLRFIGIVFVVGAVLGILSNKARAGSIDISSTFSAGFRSTVITVNGVTVHTDKKVANVSDRKITFADGSWCDVMDEVSLREGGDRCDVLEQKALEDDHETRGPFLYDARALKMQELSGDIIILPTDGDQVSLSMKGSKSKLDHIEIVEEDGILSVNSSLPSDITSMIREVLSGDLDADDAQLDIMAMRKILLSNAQITVHVPKGFDLDISGVSGHIRIGDTQGSVRLDSSGAHDVSVGHIDSFFLAARGYGDVSVKSVSGNLGVSVESTGDVDIFGGEVDLLEVWMSSTGSFMYGGDSLGSTHLFAESTGDIDITGTIANSQLVTKSIGDLTVHGAIGSMSAVARSTGDIYVGDGLVDQLYVVTESMGEFHFGGTATDAQLTTESNGDIYVGAMVNPALIQERGYGDVEIGNQ